MSEKKSTLSVSKCVADQVRVAAPKARLTLYEYVNQALTFFLKHGTIRIETERHDGSHDVQ